jgi:transposase
MIPDNSAIELTRTEKRRDFIEYRAAGHSLRWCAKALGFSLKTSQEWEHKLRDQIAVLKEDELAEAYERYGMNRIAQIETLGEELKAIDRVLSDSRRKVSAATVNSYVQLGGESRNTTTEAKHGFDSKRPVKTSTREERRTLDFGYDGIPTAKLIELKLRILDKLQALHIPIRDESPKAEFDSGSVLWACADFLSLVRSGELKGERARLEAQGLTQLVKALEIAAQGQGAGASEVLALPPRLDDEKGDTQLSTPFITP